MFCFEVVSINDMYILEPIWVSHSDLIEIDEYFTNLFV